MRRRPNGACVPVGLALVLALLLSVACAQVSVKRIDDRSNSPAVTKPITTPPPGEEHDVAITAVDFDPPLDSSLAKVLDRVSLLAVIENRGNQAEEHLGVQAQLFGVDDENPLLETALIVDRLVPGESKVVQFNGLPSVPVQSVYRLTISVHPVAGELLLWNNTRTYRVEVSAAAR